MYWISSQKILYIGANENMYDKISEKEALDGAKIVFGVLYEQMEKEFNLCIPESIQLVINKFNGYIEREDEKMMSLVIYHREVENGNFRGQFITRLLFSKIVPFCRYEVEHRIYTEDEESDDDLLIGASSWDAYDRLQHHIMQLLESVLPLYGFSILGPKELVLTLFDYQYPNENEFRRVVLGELIFGSMNWNIV